MQSSHMTGTFVHGVVLDPLRADPWDIPVNLGHIDVTLKEPPCALVTVMAQAPSTVVFSHVPQGNAPTYEKVIRYQETFLQ